MTDFMHMMVTECRPRSVLMLAIFNGGKDQDLYSIINDLERIRKDTLSAGFSDLERDTLILAYERLAVLTAPSQEAALLDILEINSRLRERNSGIVWDRGMVYDLRK